MTMQEAHRSSDLSKAEVREAADSLPLPLLQPRRRRSHDRQQEDREIGLTSRAHATAAAPTRLFSSLFGSEMAFAALRAAMLSRCTRSLSVLGRISLILGAARSQAQVQASHLHCSAPAMATMNAIRVKQFGGPEALEVRNTLRCASPISS